MPTASSAPPAPSTPAPGVIAELLEDFSVWSLIVPVFMAAGGVFMMVRNASPMKFYSGLALLVMMVVTFAWFVLQYFSKPVLLRIDRDGVSQRRTFRRWNFIPWAHVSEVRLYTDGDILGVLFLAGPGMITQEEPFEWRQRATVRVHDHAVELVDPTKVHNLQGIIDRVRAEGLAPTAKFETTLLKQAGSFAVRGTILEHIKQHKRGLQSA